MKKNARILTLVFFVAFLLLLVGCLPTPTPSNEAPIITSTPVTTATIGVLYTYDVNATDPDGDTLTYSLAVKPAGMTIKSKTGVISWRPVSTQIGNNSVTVKVSDKSLSVIQSFTIKVNKLPTVNLAPTIYSTPITTATVGVAYFYDVNATDPDNDALTYSLTNYPSGMTVSSASGLMMWTPTAKGNYAVVVKVSDGALSDTQSFTIKVSAVEPEPEIELTGIVVDPKTMTLVVGKFEAIKSVTATYEIRRSEIPIALGECTYTSSPTGIVTVDAGLVTAVAEGSSTITVSYKGKADTLVATVKAAEPTGPVHNITKDIYYDDIQEAIDGASADNTIEVMAGIYTPSSTIVINRDNLTLIGPQADVDPRLSYGNTRTAGSTEEAIIDGDLINTKYVIFIAADDVVINGFEVKFGLLDGMIYQLEPHSGTVVKYNIIHDSIQDEGVQLKKCTNGVIEYNYIYNTGGNAISFADNSHDCVIQYNETYNTNNRSAITWGGAIYTYTSTNIDIIGNKIYGPCAHGIVYGGGTKGSEIYADDWPSSRNTGGTIEGNTIYNTVGDGLLILSDDTIVEDNEIYSCDRNGIQIIGENIVVRNNNIHDNGTGILVGNLDLIFSKNVSAHYNNIYDNEMGIDNTIAGSVVGSIVIATYNWWGAESGPSGNVDDPVTGITADGSGDAVSANVRFDPCSESPNF